MHSLLKRQLRKAGFNEKDMAKAPAEVSGLLDKISKSYENFDNEKYRLTRSMTLASKEMQDLYDEIKLSTAQVIEQSKLSSLGKMASGIAHEVNNPLAIINLKVSYFMDLFEDPDEELEEEDILDVMNNIQEATNRISKIIQSLRSFAKDHKSEEIEVIPFSEVIDTVLDFCSKKLKLNNIVFKQNNIPETNLYAKRSQISQVLVNLINNAIEAHTDKANKNKYVEISAYQNSNSNLLEISIKDNGEGIDAGISHRIFEPFFTTKDVGSGTGVGLSVSKSFAESNGGTLFYEEQNISETEFILTVPVHGEEESND